MYQSIKGDVALDNVTHRPHMDLHKLIAHLDNNFGVVSDEGSVHHQAGPQGTFEALQYPDQLCDDEVGHGICTCHACRMSRRNQEDLLSEQGMPQP